MRDLKFRAWLKNEKIIIEVKEIIFYPKKQIAYDVIEYRYTDKEPFHYTQWVDFDDIELMQYTGLKDKNGVEIYEGDIVKAVGYSAIEVVYDKESCSFKMKVQYIGWEDLLILSSNKTPHLEVIGNIYENPELLKKEI